MSIQILSKSRAAAALSAIALVASACGGTGATNPPAASGPAAGTSDPGGCTSTTARASHHISAQSAAHKGLEVFAEEVSAKTDGRVTIEIFSDAQLGGLAEMSENLRSGAIEIALIDSGSLSQFEPELGVVDLPFLFQDMEQFNTLMDGDVGERVDTLVEENGITPLYWSAVGLRDLFMVDKEVRSAADLQGLTMRVPEAPVWVDTFTALGTSPTAIAASELYTALDTGVVDGFEFPLGTAVDLKMYEPVSVWSQTGHILTNILIAAAPDFIDGLCEADRNAVFEAADTARTETRALWAQDNEAAVEVLAAELTVIDDVDIDSFREAVAPVHDEFTESNGSELYDLIQDALSD
jgi:tripartite ATP-independent transporter DctP family solute receptor